MHPHQKLLSGCILVLVVWGSLGLWLTPQSQAGGADSEILPEQRVADHEQRRAQLHQKRRSIALDRLTVLPPCGSGTKGQRWVVSKDGTIVCDDKTGLWWQGIPGHPSVPNNICENAMACEWQQAKDYCTNLKLTRKPKNQLWRRAKVKVLIGLVDYGVQSPGLVLPPGNPFTDIGKSVNFWSATELAGNSIWCLARQLRGWRREAGWQEKPPPHVVRKRWLGMPNEDVLDFSYLK